MTLLPYVWNDQAGLVTIWNDGGSSLSFWRSVFERNVPQYIEIVESKFGVRIDGNTTREITEELLAVIAEAYRESASSAEYNVIRLGCHDAGQQGRVTKGQRPRRLE